MQEELGDVPFVVARFAHLIGVQLSDAAADVVEKTRGVDAVHQRQR